jgi:Spy/CpxP family protein refolding chaperone
MLSKILAIAVLSAAMASAQRGGGMGGSAPSGPGATDGGGWGSARPKWQSPFDQFATRLKLDKDQRAAVETIVDAAQKDMVAAQQKLVEARKELVLAMLEPKSDPAVVARLTAAYTALSVEAKAVESTAFGKICALLKPNQLSKAVPTFALLVGLVEPSAVGFPTGGRPGPQGGGPR